MDTASDPSHYSKQSLFLLQSSNVLDQPPLPPQHQNLALCPVGDEKQNSPIPTQSQEELGLPGPDVFIRQLPGDSGSSGMDWATQRHVFLTRR